MRNIRASIGGVDLDAVMQVGSMDIQEWFDSAKVGAVIAPDPDRLPAAMVESTTEFDWAELPESLRDSLRDWCRAFSDWAA